MNTSVNDQYISYYSITAWTSAVQYLPFPLQIAKTINLLIPCTDKQNVLNIKHIDPFKSFKCSFFRKVQFSGLKSYFKHGLNYVHVWLVSKAV